MSGVLQLLEAILIDWRVGPIKESVIEQLLFNLEGLVLITKLLIHWIISQDKI